MAELSETAKRLIQEPNIGHLATVMPDGSPQVTPIWIDLEGSQVLFNTATGRVKERNIRRDPRVGLSVANRDDPYERITIRGRVVEILDGEEAVTHIDKMAQKYLGRERYPWHKPDEQRLIVRIAPKSESR